MKQLTLYQYKKVSWQCHHWKIFWKFSIGKPVVSTSSFFFLSLFLFFFLFFSWILNAVNIHAVMCLCFRIQLLQWHTERCIHCQLPLKLESLCCSMTWLDFGKERFKYSVTKIGKWVCSFQLWDLASFWMQLIARRDQFPGSQASCHSAAHMPEQFFTAQVSWHVIQLASLRIKSLIKTREF